MRLVYGFNPSEISLQMRLLLGFRMLQGRVGSSFWKPLHLFSCYWNRISGLCLLWTLTPLPPILHQKLRVVYGCVLFSHAPPILQLEVELDRYDWNIPGSSFSPSWIPRELQGASSWKKATPSPVVQWRLSSWEWTQITHGTILIFGNIMHLSCVTIIYSW